MSIERRSSCPLPAFDPDNISELFHDPGKHAFDPVLDGRQYVPILGAWINIAIQALNNFDPSAHERFHFLKVVGRKSYVGDTKESENVRWHANPHRNR
jgi:hypothetical protein